MRKMFISVLTLFMMLACVSTHVVFARAVKLSTTALTVEKGKKKSVTLKGATKTVTWSASNKKIISLKPQGKKKSKVTVTGKKVGSCLLTAKMAGKSYVCRVTVTKKDSFKEKAISKSAVNKTKNYKAQKMTSRQASDAFKDNMADASFELFLNVMADSKKNTNILISPDSIITALMLLENGADGKTLSEMKKVLGKDVSVKAYNESLATMHKRLTSSKQTSYRIANAFWYRNKLMTPKKAYLQKIVDYYQADIYSAPFNNQTVKDINNYVYNNTRGKISEIIDRLDPSSRAVLLNAIHFKGAWETPYQDTVKRDFTRQDGTKTKTEMLEGTESTYIKMKGAEGFVKYYAGGDFAFVGLLPPKDTTLKDYMKTVKGSDFINAYNKRKTQRIKVYTRMPVFSYEDSHSLNKVLKAMGMKTMYTDRADFSKMSNDSLAVDDVLHKTYIKLNEKGTEAAAVTAIIAKSTAVLEDKMTIKKVYLDRPFLYAIIDTTTGMPLFMGACYQPSK